jgi:hypothetical protein
MYERFLTGEGAKQWTKTRGYPIVEDEALIERKISSKLQAYTKLKLT